MRRVRCQAQLTVDAKGRLALPKAIRAALVDAGSPPMVLAFQKGAIWAWTRDVFERTIEAPLAEADPFDEDVMAFAHALLANATDIEMDGQGRIRLPAHLRDYAGIGKDVVVHSIVNHIEIWDKAAWDARYQEALHQHRGMSGMPRGQG